MEIFKFIVLEKAVDNHKYMVNKFWIIGKTLVKEQWGVLIDRNETEARMGGDQAEIFFNGKSQGTISKDRAMGIYGETTYR
jgi:hypothetical protein